MKRLVLALLCGCWQSLPPSASVNAPVAECPPVLGGSVHDLDDADEQLVGATIVFGERTTITDEHGEFLIDELPQPQATLEVYYADATATAPLPACMTKLLWIGIHMHEANNAVTAAVVRMEERSLDLAVVRREGKRRKVLATAWMKLYEAFADIVERDHADCAKLATSLEQFMFQHRSEIDAIARHHATSSSREREQFADTIKHQFGDREAQLELKTAGIDACTSEPRVRAALRDFPR